VTDTYLIGSTDIRSSVRGVASLEGLYDVPDVVGDDISLSGVDGQAESKDRTFGTGAFTLQMVLSASDITTRSDAIRDLTRLLRPGRTVTVTRQRTYTSGAESHTALCRYVAGLSPSMVGVSHAKLAVVMKVLGGVWDGSPTSLGTFSVGTTSSGAVVGDTRTRKMTLTFAGATSGTVTLTNNTNGYAVSYTGATNTTPVVVDVAARTATQGASDVSANLAWTKLVPFQLDEGVNSLTVSGGAGTRTVAISYTPAYL
jgi:hypothetical protein